MINKIKEYWQHVSEFHQEGHKIVKLLDNNIGADKEWFFENTNWIIDHNLKVNICQGMDIRILTEEVAEQLARLKFVDNIINFAWDNIEDEEKSSQESKCSKKLASLCRKYPSTYSLDLTLPLNRTSTEHKDSEKLVFSAL